MNWQHLSVDGDMGIENGVVCAHCSSVIYDLVYFLEDWDSDEAKALEHAVKSDKLFMENDDPYTFSFCEDCKHGLSTLSLPLQAKG